MGTYIAFAVGLVGGLLWAVVGARREIAAREGRRVRGLDILIDPATITAAPADTPITTPAAFMASDERHRDFPAESLATSEAVQPAGDVSLPPEELVILLLGEMILTPKGVKWYLALIKALENRGRGE
jgi:hypothetical protein